MASITKQQLRLIYGLEPKTLQRLMNVTFYEELQKVGYVKTCVTLSPRVVDEFIKLWGEPDEKMDKHLKKCYQNHIE